MDIIDIIDIIASFCIGFTVVGMVLWIVHENGRR